MYWTAIKDKRPRHGQRVIYYFEVTGIDIGKYERVEYPKEFTKSGEPVYGNMFSGNGGFLVDDVTHWMELPEIPLAGTDNH